MPLIPKIPNFSPIEKKDKLIFDYFFRRYSQNMSEFNFTILFCYRDIKKHEFCIIDGHLLVSHLDNAQRRFYQPVGGNPAKIIRKVLSFFPQSSFEKVEKKYTNELKGDFIIKHDRDFDDYLYKIPELKELKGQKFAAKRNFIRRFAEYKPNIKALAESKISDCLNLEKRWLTTKANSISSAEDTALKEALMNYKKLNLHGIAVLINNKVEGFAIGEPLNSNTFVEHFEKANTNFVGIYQYLLNEFAKSITNKFVYLNREQDLGIEGLRKSKMSYYPCGMVEKYKIKNTSPTCAAPLSQSNLL